MGLCFLACFFINESGFNLRENLSFCVGYSAIVSQLKITGNLQSPVFCQPLPTGGSKAKPKERESSGSFQSSALA